jgi:ABC-type transport system involved in cytochrome c biogenesis permease subunit
MAYAGIVLHASYVLYRGIAAGRLPIVGLYDTLLFMSLSIVIFSLAMRPYISQKKHFMSANAISAAAFLIPVIFLKPNNNPLPPVLDTYWFEVHVVLSFFAYALFILGGVIGALFIINKEAVLERLQYRSIFIGYTFFSVAMIAGGIWAFYAWGTYWLWTAKEFWTSILWLYYSVYLHVRLQNRLAGRPASLIGTCGVIVMLFTYLGVGILMKSSHSF